MNQSTRFPEAPRLDTVLVTRVGPGRGYAFGVASDGLSVFIHSALLKRLGVTAGDRVEGALTPNKVKPQQTPWYLEHGVVTSGGEKRDNDIEMLLALLTDSGGAWTADDLWAYLMDPEPSTEQNVSRATGAMETAHMAKRVSKIVMFDHTSDDRKVWYTVYPDQIDVDEFDVDEFDVDEFDDILENDR
jgi:hypothetical protein